MTAAVLAVGLSAAGVKTLDIVPAPGYEPGSAAGAQQTGPGSLPQQTLAEQARPDRTEVDSSPVTPKVREIKVSGIASRADAGRSSTATATPAPTAKPTPSKQAPQKAQAQDQKQDQADPSQATKRVVAQSAPQKVRGYATVGVTWKHGVDYTEDQIGVQVRTEKDGRWSGWMTAAYHDEHGPDAGTAEEESSRERPGTDALVIGSVDQVQMRAETTDGKAPTDLKLAVIDPGKGSLVKEAPAIDTAKIAPSSSPAKTQAQGDADQPQASGDLTVQTDDGPDQIALSAMKKAAKPTIYSRAQWGANERMRDQSAPSYGTVKAGFIHHTVNANNYSASQVPSLLRGIYAYHTQSRGWRDIGYNYLVDRFGRIWEGRYGGVTRAVVGAHTLGYNEVSFAMSAIGNFDITRPPAAVLTAYARLFAWKLSLYNIRADAPRVYVKNRYLHAINGHRDVGQTACPGRYLYAQIPYVRTLAQRIQNAAQSGGGTTTPTPPKPAPAPTPATPPKLFHTPTQMPQKWTTQSTRIVYPKATNIAGSSYPDLALKRADGRIVIQPTGGQAGFKAPVTTTGGWKSMDLVAAVGDVTGDGKGDVLARLRSGGTTRVYAGDGAGHVTTRGIGTTTAFRTARSIMTAGDWNRDKRPDVLMRDKYSRLWMVPGAGGGRFGRPVLLSKSWGGFSSTSVPGDLTGDGRPDVVAIHHTGYLYLVPSTSRHTLGTPVRLSKVGSTYDSVVGGARDLTGDSDPDVVIRSSRSGKVAIVAGSRKARLGSTYAWTTAAASLRQLSASQVAGSAQADLVGVSGDKLVVLPHNGLSNLRPARASNLTVSDATQVLSVGSWNGDKYGDVITRVAGGDVLMLHRGQGNGNFVRRVKMSGGWRSITSLAAVGDVTGDRNPDLAGKTASGQMRIFPGNGKNGFLAPRTAPATMKTFNTLGTGSWRPLVAGSRFTSSDGSFVPYVGTTGRNPAGYDWVIGPGDVNGDGRSDLVTRDGAGSLWLLPGTPTAYAEPRLLGTGFGGYRLGG